MAHNNSTLTMTELPPRINIPVYKIKYVQCYSMFLQKVPIVYHDITALKNCTKCALMKACLGNRYTSTIDYFWNNHGCFDYSSYSQNVYKKVLYRIYL